MLPATSVAQDIQDIQVIQIHEIGHEAMKITTLMLALFAAMIAASFVTYGNGQAHGNGNGWEGVGRGTEQVTKQGTKLVRFPPNPTRRDVAKRVPDWRGFVNLGRCEQPGPSKYHDGVQWGHKGPTYGGGVGLFAGTWRSVGSPYKVFSGDKWETILVSDAVRDRFGITAWGAHACFHA